MATGSATVEEVARSSLAALATDASFLLGCQYTAERYQQLCNRLRFRHLRELGRARTIPVFTTGLVNVVRGSELVTCDATMKAALTNALLDRYIRVHINWYNIKEVDLVNGTLTIQPEYSEVDGNGLSYKIVARRTPLDVKARHIGQTMVHTRLRRPMNGPLTMVEFDLRHPERQLVGPPPVEWCQTEDVITSSGERCLSVEAYPYPTEGEVLTYVMWKKPPYLQREEIVPEPVGLFQLKQGVLVDIMRYNASMAATPGPKFNLESAAYWRNEYRAQETKWEEVVKEIGKADRSVDDLTFILSMTRSVMGLYSDIRNARDEVYVRGIRP